ncbi:CCA tRNA nucleotidyltransferase [Paenibacillus mesophilus]|uniref:CCA tRNA nucleotidyltransferase n=1 Tax=Paenibacillus mesophilus TaxID=2582849 RepID=UPI00110F2981|nr:CCA tRNA nucleotidyltransferase [Paenibacillus mesophilus]TMV51241.1 CCA tRNA nucleotidyltransferase [Paenibacillus mesophilus]
MSITMEREGKEVLRRLGQAGYEAYFVGGCVRDKLLGRPLKDIDIATSALPEVVMRLFARTAPTGLQHGTVTVIMERHTFEVTTFRKESEYEQFRRPKEVEFISDLNEDLRRRDFTINAMALDAEGASIDPFGGADDLAAGRIRCVGNPMERFHEDALRMLRGIRFACEYGFELEADTWSGLLQHAPLLVHVAMERVSAELDKMIEGRAPDRAVRLLTESGLPRHFKQPIDWPLSGWERCPEPIERDSLAKIIGPSLRWTALFILMGMDSVRAKEAMKRLKFAGKKSDSILKLLQTNVWMEERLGTVSIPDASADSDKVGFELTAECCVTYGKSVVSDWLSLAAWRTDVLGEDRFIPLIERGREWVKRVPVDQVNELNVSGSELAEELRMKPGPWLGRLLQRLLADTARRRLPNERPALLRQAKLLAKQECD